MRWVVATRGVPGWGRILLWRRVVERVVRIARRVRALRGGGVKESVAGSFVGCMVAWLVPRGRMVSTTTGPMISTVWVAVLLRIGRWMLLLVLHLLGMVLMRWSLLQHLLRLL